MGVFEKLYTDNYNDASVNKELQSNYTDNVFGILYRTTLFSTFSWKGIPNKGLPSFMLEQFYQMAGVVAMDEVDGNHEILPAFPSGKLLPNTMYDKFTLIAPDGTMRIRNLEDIVVGFNNSLRIPYAGIADSFAKKSSHALQAVDMALDKACLPTLIQTNDPNMLKELLNLKSHPENLHTFMATLKAKYGDSEIASNNIFDNRQNDVLALWDVYVRYRNLFYTTFGINNVEIQKRERLTQAEGSGNDEITRYSLLNDMYERRKEFIAACKEKFGVEMSCEINRDVTTVYQIETPNEQKIENAQIEVTKGANLPIGGGNNENNQ